MTRAARLGATTLERREALWRRSWAGQWRAPVSRHERLHGLGPSGSGSAHARGDQRERHPGARSHAPHLTATIPRMRLGRVVGIGCRAARLLREEPDARVLAPLNASIYIVVPPDEILWLGGPHHALHPRAVLLSKLPVAPACMAGDTIRVPQRRSPLVAARGPIDARALRRCGRAARWRRGASLERASLRRAPLAAPRLFRFRRRRQRVRSRLPRRRRARRRRGRDGCSESARTTPSGDDFVGGALSRGRFCRAGHRRAAGWRSAAERVVQAARGLTHPSSVTAARHLLRGRAGAAARPVEASPATTVAGTLPRPSHWAWPFSGWDLLAGRQRRRAEATALASWSGSEPSAACHSTQGNT